MRTFRRVTMGKPVVMGRKTFSSLKKPLDGRDNIVVTRDPDFTAPEGVRVVLNIPDAMALAAACAADRGVDEIAVIGGADIFRAVLPTLGACITPASSARPLAILFSRHSTSRIGNSSRPILCRGRKAMTSPAYSTFWSARLPACRLTP